MISDLAHFREPLNWQWRSVTVKMVAMIEFQTLQILEFTPIYMQVYISIHQSDASQSFTDGDFQAFHWSINITFYEL